MSNSLFTISAFTENSTGVLHRLTTVLTRRRINIESLCVSETERKGISRFTISIFSTEEAVRKVALQIERIIEVVSVEFHRDEALIYREIAFFRVKAVSSKIRSEIEEQIRRYGASVIYATSDAVIIERTGTESDINSLFYLLEPLGIEEFVRSGRIAMSKTGTSGGSVSGGKALVNSGGPNFPKGADSI
jgi:acetolactate synthase I/III small subunit